MTTLFSIIESPMQPKLSGLYQQLGITEVRLPSIRKAISELKKQPPDIVVAEFFYGYGNNYAGVNISNLDVFLFSLQKFAPKAKVIVLVDKAEHHYVDKLNNIIPLFAVLTQPVYEMDIRKLLSDAE
ncbi:MAG: hypothetical protein OEY89_08950 [Gammaproteobacteria bacterium]|nr:hypothetical protein [Gammaproteobacteria bacterium]